MKEPKPRQRPPKSHKGPIETDPRYRSIVRALARGLAREIHKNTCTPGKMDSDLGDDTLGI